MSAGTEGYHHWANRNLRRAAYCAAMDRLLPSGPATQFQRDPDLPGLAASMLREADETVTPVVRLLMTGEPFQIDGDAYHVDRVMPSARGPQVDILILRGLENARCPERTICRALQVRDLEELVGQDRVQLAFGTNARMYNLAAGWGRKGRTIGSRGIRLERGA